MKKIIMFVMVLAISAPALADDLNPPDWAGAPGTIYGIWNFPTELPDGDGEMESFPFGDYPEVGLMVPHETNDDPCEYDETIDTEVAAHQHMMIIWGEFSPTWEASYEGRQGVLLPHSGFSPGSYNFSGEGTTLIRLQMTYFGEGEIAEFYFDDEVADPPEEQIEIGDGWTHSTWDFTYDSGTNPDETSVYFQVFNDFAIDQIIMDVISYPGVAPPDGPGRPGGPKPAITVDSNDLPVYEPADADGPPLLGPTEGQLLVSLAWQPGDPTYPATFTATVTVEPNEVGPNEDFTFIKPPTDPNGNVYLTFTEANWNVPQQVQVKAIQDLDKEGYIKYPIELTVTIDIADPNFGNPTPVVVESSVGVVDNDIPFVVTYPPGALWDVLEENDPCVPKCIDIILSHLPTDDVYVLVTRYSDNDDYDTLLEDMSVMDPPLDYLDPNKLHFTVSGNPTWNSTTMTSNWNVAQQICLEARDDPCLAEAELEWVGGEIVFTPYSEDERYRVSWLDPDGSESPIIPDDPCDPCAGGEPDSGGEAEETTVVFNVQDNECGSVGYPPYDVNEDCVVGLSDVAILYNQWMSCTDPYDGGASGWVDCCAVWERDEDTGECPGAP